MTAEEFVRIVEDIFISPEDVKVLEGILKESVNYVYDSN